LRGAAIPLDEAVGKRKHPSYNVSFRLNDGLQDYPGDKLRSSTNWLSATHWNECSGTKSGRGAMIKDGIIADRDEILLRQDATIDELREQLKEMPHKMGVSQSVSSFRFVPVASRRLARFPAVCALFAGRLFVVVPTPSEGQRTNSAGKGSDARQNTIQARDHDWTCQTH
jgi:hypothetical protein